MRRSLWVCAVGGVLIRQVPIVKAQALVPMPLKKGLWKHSSVAANEDLPPMAAAILAVKPGSFLSCHIAHDFHDQPGKAEDTKPPSKAGGITCNGSEPTLSGNVRTTKAVCDMGMLGKMTTTVTETYVSPEKTTARTDISFDIGDGRPSNWTTLTIDTFMKADCGDLKLGEIKDLN